MHGPLSIVEAGGGSGCVLCNFFLNALDLVCCIKAVLRSELLSWKSSSLLILGMVHLIISKMNFLFYCELLRCTQSCFAKKGRFLQRRAMFCQCLTNENVSNLFIQNENGI